jgi:hypothetical protein
MKKMCILSCIAAIVSLCAAEEAPAKPGFWKRAWGKTKDGVGSVWDATKGVGKKTADVVTAPFGKKGGQEPSGATAWRNLAMSVKLDPAKVRLSETRVIEVTVSVVNNGKTAVQLEFPNSLRVDVIVKDGGGKIISRWSDDQPIEKEPGILLINPKERLEYSAKVSTREMTAGKPFEIEAYFPSYDRLRTSRTVVPEK